MTKGTGFRQEQILELLLYAKNGLSIDEISAQLKISRNAIKQHLVVLENANLVMADNIKLNFTGGRPSRNYILTTQGINQFPKQYAWFSQLLLTDLKSEMGEDAFGRYMTKLGEKLANSMVKSSHRESGDQVLLSLIEAMKMLGYHAELKDSTIQAFNCVYHDLAQQFPELCAFDRALMSTWVGKTIEQTQCMAKGDCVCRFQVKGKIN